MKPEPTYEELMAMNAKLKEQLVKALEALIEVTNKMNNTKP